MTCDLVRDEANPRRWVCSKCEREIVTHKVRECLGGAPKCRKPGLGDYVERTLKAVGIHAKKRCGCGKRQAVLNRVGKWLGF